MTRMVEGRLDGSGKRFGVVLSRFNDMIGRRLLDGAVDCFVRHGVEPDDITVARVPGSFEIPFLAKRMAETDKHPDADDEEAAREFARGVLSRV